MKTLHLLILTLIALLAAPVASFAQLPVAGPTVEGPFLDGPTLDQPESRCVGPDITFHNTSSYDITITSMKYYDACNAKDRSEGLSNVFLPHGYYVRYWSENLAYVENCYISHFHANFSWGGNSYTSDPIVPSQGSKVRCVTNVDYDIYLTDTNLF